VSNSNHSHPVQGGKATARIAGDVDAVIAALEARVAKLEGAPAPTPVPTPPPTPAPSGMLVALAMGKWNVPLEAKACVNTVTLPDAANAAAYRAAGLGVIAVIIGPYNQGGVQALNPDTFAANAVSLVKANPGLIAVELCNEPGGEWFWGAGAGSAGNAAAYATLIRKTRAAFTAAGLTTKLLASFDGGHAGATGWGKAVMAADPGAYSVVDAITMHPYGGTGTKAESALGARQGTTDAHNLSGKPVWITELGWPTAIGQPATGDSLQWTEAEQAANITNFVGWARAQGWIGLVTIFMWADYGSNNWYGVTKSDGVTRKPSFAALAAVSR
jgi:putative glycosyl hydrolase